MNVIFLFSPPSINIFGNSPLKKVADGFLGACLCLSKGELFFNVLQRKLDMPPVCVYFIQNSSTTLLPKKNSDFISLMTCVLYVRSVTT